jgi:hypothetical protein
METENVANELSKYLLKLGKIPLGLIWNPVTGCRVANSTILLRHHLSSPAFSGGNAAALVAKFRQVHRTIDQVNYDTY